VLKEGRKKGEKLYVQKEGKKLPILNQV